MIQQFDHYFVSLAMRLWEKLPSFHWAEALIVIVLLCSLFLLVLRLLPCVIRITGKSPIMYVLNLPSRAFFESITQMQK